ncbi:DUF805 domain-containing protein [Pseudooceanicola algae]|uniref:Uncharacterized protein n=1 Tax=Pseudooceanicola algae TaxID=1537215 RepID=A0A418SJR9_9RHOB|nr:DUF805 domain-containing protein [Pseudooceanicola algae]QPM90670.1 hypothetical protein PSAL_019090 [Pseudooceanicola algae]
MGFAESIKTCFRNYVTFSGRAARPEYWYFMLFVILCSAILGMLDNALFGSGGFRTSSQTSPGSLSATAGYGNGPLGSLFNIVTLFPILAAGWRRMHDTGRSGIFLFYPMIVMFGTLTFGVLFGGLVGATDALLSGDIVTALFGGLGGLMLALCILVLLVSPLVVIWWLSRPSQPGPNRWGPAPLQTEVPPA